MRIINSCINGLLLTFGLVACAFSENTVEVDTSASVNAYTRMLEQTKSQIDYCLMSLDKKLTEVDIGKVNVGWGFQEVGRITYGLIAKKYEMQYGDVGKAADYYYLEWRHTPLEFYPRGEYSPLGMAIGLWRQAGRYSDLVVHYDEYLLDLFGPLKVGSKQTRLKSMQQNLRDEEVRRRYDKRLRDLKVYRKLAKTSSPESLDPTVQNHEWFYSDKQEEVLRALAYYRQNKVQFMLEKALAHKDPIVAGKAKEYLENLKKGETNETENKKP